MKQVRANEIVDDIRSGMEDIDLIGKYRLSGKGLQRVLMLLVTQGLMNHEELYKKSRSYRAVADILATRRSPRIRVPSALRICHEESCEKGFVRDISDGGVRVAGLRAQKGDTLTLRLPPQVLIGDEPLEFKAVCRWTRTGGKRRQYAVSGFEITDISPECRYRFLELLALFTLAGASETSSIYRPTERLKPSRSTGVTTEEIESYQFSGHVEGIDILDFVQFLLLTGKQTILEIRSSGGREGRLYIDHGRIIHADQGELTGKAAFFSCMSFLGGEFTTQPFCAPSGATIADPGDFLLMEAARLRDEAPGQSEGVSSDEITSLEAFNLI